MGNSILNKCYGERCDLILAAEKRQKRVKVQALIVFASRHCVLLFKGFAFGESSESHKIHYDDDCISKLKRKKFNDI